MDFRLLGPVEARAAGRLIDLGYPKQRAVLAALILEHNQVVPTERLIDRVWGAAPPASVRNVLYGYIARLRAALTRTGEPGTAIARRPGGYLLGIELDQVDLFRFRRQVAEAESTSDQEVAAELLRGALALWRGPALAGLSGPWFSGLRETLEQQRLGALLDLGDIGLAQGRHNALIGDLTKEAVAYPADERLIGQLMLALYRSGRQSEALQWFERTRRRLAEDFGADPGPGLQSLHQRILRADRSLIPPARARVREWGGPRELPADVPAFVGRTAELSELDRLLATAVSAPRDRPATGQAGNGVPIYAISGTAGVGKTALAVRWAHQVRGHFPDGQLYVDLRGYGIEQPTPAADALAAFLRSLGVAGADIPARFEEQAARYRTLLNGKRLLIILDNAATAEQVRSLLPGHRPAWSL